MSARLALGAVLVVLLGIVGVQAYRLAGSLRATPPPEPLRPASAPPDERRAEPAVAAPRATQLAPSAQASGERELYERNRAGVETLERGELDAAIELFERCVAERADEPVFAHNLAEALARRAQRDVNAEDAETREAALADIERAVELAADRPELARLRDRWRKGLESEEGFWRKKTLHFELAFDGDRSELLAGTAPLENELESAYHELGELFGWFPVEAGRPRIRVVLLRREEFGAVTGLGDWAGGVFDGSVRVSVEDLAREEERVERALRHELVHAFVHDAGGPGVPGWLNEGLAQWLEAPFFADRPRDVQSARERLRDATPFELARLRGTLASWSDVAEIERAYAQSLAFVDHLRATYGERLVFDLVTGCKEGRAPEETFETRIGVALDVAHADFVDSL